MSQIPSCISCKNGGLSLRAFVNQYFDEIPCVANAFVNPAPQPTARWRTASSPSAREGADHRKGHGSAPGCPQWMFRSHRGMGAPRLFCGSGIPRLNHAAPELRSGWARTMHRLGSGDGLQKSSSGGCRHRTPHTTVIPWSRCM